MEELSKQAFNKVCRISGKSLNTTISTLIPPEVVKESSMFSGLRRLGDSMECMGGKKGGKYAEKNYIPRKMGGVIADTSIGFVLLGGPVTLYSALFADGSKVISKILKGAKTEEESVRKLGEFFEDMSVISGNFMKLFDVPKKETIVETRDSIHRLLEKMKKEHAPKKVITELEHLEKLASKKPPKEVWGDEVKRSLRLITEEEVEAVEKNEKLKESLLSFIREPSVQHISKSKKDIVEFFSREEIEVHEESRRFADEFVKQLEKISSEDFHRYLRGLIIKHYALAEKTSEKANDMTIAGYKVMTSFLNMGERGVKLFGNHYLDQLGKLVKVKG